MLFQEAVELIARGNAKEHPKLVAGNASLTVGFEADGLKCGTRKVLAGGRKIPSQFVWDFERDPHLNTGYHR
jgi:hypothetical protein